MTSKPRATDPAEPAGTERLVIRDKRRIDPTGTRTRSARHAAADPADAATATEHRPAGRHARSGPEEEPVSAQANGDTAGGSADTATGADRSAEPAGATQPGADRSGDRDQANARSASGTEAEQASDPDPTDTAVVDEPVVGEVVESTETADDTQPQEPAAQAGGFGAELTALRTELDERIRDLQRVTAEYANYRKRVERDKGLVSEQATGAVLAALLPILDDLDRAREHGDLVGPFGTVAEQLSAALNKFGLTPFGEKGDPFDPTRHEAVAHLTSADVTEPTCIDVMRRGYLLGDRLLRAALVAVADPE
jgi:molecular chaperone GrpE